jgi:quercetin dioxygenase-like cupin family protein
LSWHIHPDAHEIAYVIEGTLTFQRAGEAPEQLAAGAADYLHRISCIAG